jgi:hypothetical protein
MIRKVTFYWVLLTMVLVDSWLLSKPNILGKIGLLIYKYHYLRSFPRTLLTVWIVVSTSVLIVLLIQYLNRQEKLSKSISTVVLAACVVGSLLVLGQVYIDFTSWSYSHTGLKFRYGAYLLPAILVFVFINGLTALHLKGRSPELTSISQSIETLQADAQISPDTSLPLQP